MSLAAKLINSLKPAILALLVLSPCHAWAESDPALVAAAKKEGTVSWSSGLIVDQAVRPIAAAFEKKYGIHVETSPGSNLVLRLTGEARAGRRQVDVFDSGGGALGPLRAADLLEAYDSPEAAAYGPTQKDSEHYWTDLCFFYLTAAVNTDLVPLAEEPKSYQDLLDPKWKGKMVWAADDSLTGGPGFVGNILMTMGEQAGMDYLKRLAGQDITRMAGNARNVIDQVIIGQYPLALMMYHHHAARSGAEGAPVKWLKMNPLVENPAVVSIVKNSPHPNAAKLFYDYVLSEEGQGVLREASYVPAHPRVSAKTAELKPDAGGFEATAILPTMNQTKLPEWSSIYNRLFVK